MRYIHILLSNLLTLVALQLVAQETHCYLVDPGFAPRERQVDFINLSLNIRFQPDSGKVIGTVEHDFKAIRNGVDSIFLDAINMEIKSCQLNGKPVDYNWSNTGIGIRIGKELELHQSYRLKIDYEATPRKGLYFIGWDDPTGRSRKQIWTQGQGIDNRHWIPMFDDMADKITTNIRVIMDEKYEVLSNGMLENAGTYGQGKKAWFYRMHQPHSPYLIMLGIGEYNVKTERTESGILLKQYSYKDRPETHEPTYRYSTEIFKFLEDEIGAPYPWGAYAQIPVQDFPYGAMENTTATVFGDFFCVDSMEFNDKNYVFVNGHELTHQWFGDLVTSRSPRHHWLHESFATYFHCLTAGMAFGEDEFSKMMFENQQAALAASEHDVKGVGHSRAGSGRHYLKGSYVLRMLRYVVGDAEFKLGLQKYLKDHAYGLVNTQDLIDAYYDTTGLDIEWFIDQWVYKGGEPHLKVDFKTDKKNKRYQFIVEQLQDTTPLVATFKMPVSVEVNLKNGTKLTQQFWLRQHKDTFELPFTEKEKIDYVLFDPNQEILKQLYFDRPVSWLLSQAQQATHMIDRYEALLQLRSVAIKEKAAILRKVYEKETYYLAKGEALSQLLKGGAEVQNEVADMVANGTASLQSQVLSSWPSIPKSYESEVNKLLKANSYQVIQLALVRLVSSFPDNTDYYLKQVAHINGSTDKKVRIQYLEIQALRNNDQAARDELVDYTSNSYNFNIRQNAVAVLKRLNYCNQELVDNLCLGIMKANWKVAKSCGLLLRHFYQTNQTEYVQLIENKMKALADQPEVLKRLETYAKKKS